MPKNLLSDKVKSNPVSAYASAFAVIVHIYTGIRFMVRGYKEQTKAGTSPDETSFRTFIKQKFKQESLYRLGPILASEL